MAAALLDGFEATLDRRYFAAAEAAVKLVLEKYADSEGGGFFDRSSDAPPLGGLDVRRKPLQDSPTPGGNPVAVMVLDRLYAYTGERALPRAGGERAGGVCRSRAAVWAVCGDVRAGFGAARAACAADRGDRAGGRRNRRAIGARRALVLSLWQGGAAPYAGEFAVDRLPPRWRETLPHLRADQAQAFVCAGGRAIRR